MAIEIREYVGAEFIQLKQSSELNKNNIKNLTEYNTIDTIDEDSIMVDIEGICSTLTRNYTLYEPNCLKESVPYWTKPYERPVIMHHNERDGVTIGRIKVAEYNDKNTRSGTPALTFTVNIPHEEGKKGVKNGTLSTVSIGAIAHDVRCSICGLNIADVGMCEHEKGEMYDDKLCYWIIKKMEPKELSYVIVPSDIYAHNLRVYNPPKRNKLNITKEHSEVNELMTYNPFADLIRESAEELEEVKAQTKKDQQEKIITDEEVKEEVASKKAETKEIKEEEAKEENTESETKEVEKEEVEKTESEESPKEEKADENKSEEESKEAKEESAQEEGSKELELELEIVELKKVVEELKAANEKLIKQLGSEKKLRECAESELVGFKTAKKKGLIEQINNVRESLSLEKQDESILMESSNEMLEMTLKTVKEFSTVSSNMLNIQQIKSDVIISENNDNTTKVVNVAEAKQTKKDIAEMDLMEAMNSVWEI